MLSIQSSTVSFIQEHTEGESQMPARHTDWTKSPPSVHVVSLRGKSQGPGARQAWAGALLLPLSELKEVFIHSLRALAYFSVERVGRNEPSSFVVRIRARLVEFLWNRDSFVDIFR